MIILFAAFCTLAQPATCSAQVQEGQFQTREECVAAAAALPKTINNFEVASWWCMDGNSRVAHGRFK